MTEESAYYEIARLQERLIHEAGDLDLTVTSAGDVICITGSVASPEQRDLISAIARDAFPTRTVRNETALPRVADSLPPERIDP